LTKDNEGDAERWRDLAGTGPSIGRPLLERLLLSLIDAHPNPKTGNPPYWILHDRERRLRAAMEALFNEKKDKDEKVAEQLLDHAALFWMAQQYVRDRQLRYAQQRGLAREVGAPRSAGARTSCRSERQLARDASEKFYPNLADQSERLRKNWRKRKEFWLAMARRHDDVLETLETQALAKIWIALTEADVPVIPNWPEGRAMSEDQMLRTGLPELERLVDLRRKG
jgi:hypothetical protein